MAIVDCYRIVTFVPVDSLETVIEALSKSEVLSYGNYKDVLWYSVPGTEQFEPVVGANPTLGQIGVRERTPSIKLEFSILRDEEKLDHLINNILIPIHPWEEPGLSIYEVKETRKEEGGVG